MLRLCARQRSAGAERSAKLPASGAEPHTSCRGGLDDPDDIPAWLCAPQDRLLAALHTMFLQVGLPGAGLCGAPLASAALQLLPIAFTARMCPWHWNERQVLCGNTLVRLACKRRCASEPSTAQAAVCMTEVMQSLRLTLCGCVVGPRPPGSAGRHQGYPGCLRGLEPVRAQRPAARAA